MLKNLKESQLLQALRLGESNAVRQWYQEYGPKVRTFIAQKISSEADVDELVQETFMNCLKHLPLFRGEAGIWTWMCGVAKHEVSDYYRKKYAKKAITALPLSELLVGAHIQGAHETSEQITEHVAHVLQSLSEEAQEVLLMKYVDGKKVEEIAEQLQRSVKAIESELFRARRNFRAAYTASLAVQEL
jgi:RNA polymerase sigma-70 factor (ECF subfamily)